MRVRALAVAGLVVAGAAVATQGDSVSAAPGATATVVKVIRPVTAAGHVAPAFHARRKAGRVDCSFANPSPGAVDRNIEFCSPSYLQAVACWNAAKPGHVLCMPDPSLRKVDRLRRQGRFASTGLAPAKERAPLVLLLTDGTKCFIRDGGAWEFIRHHPRWSGTYSCDHHGFVWAKPRMPHSGIDESAPSWTVQTSPGSWPLVTRRVATAYFVGTLHG